MFRKIARLFKRPKAASLSEFKDLLSRFQQILRRNNRVLELISELEDKLSGEYIFDINYLKDRTDQLSEAVYIVSSSLNVMSGNRYRHLLSRQAAIREELNGILQGFTTLTQNRLVVDCESQDCDMAALTGGKNANLAEIAVHLGMPIPEGFVISTEAYRQFMSENKLWPEIHRIRDQHLLEKRDVEAYDLAIEELFAGAVLPHALAREVEELLEKLRENTRGRLRLAVRSSAYGEDSLGQSYAGQFQTFLNCSADMVLPMYKEVITSRFKHRVVEYAGRSVFEEDLLPMAAGVQTMIEAHAAGVAYSVDPSRAHSESLIISSTFGLGEGVVDGTVETDLYRISRLDCSKVESVDVGCKSDQSVALTSPGLAKLQIPSDLQNKPSLSKAQAVQLAEQVLLLERYFRRPVDVEWCVTKDGRFYIVQCRPLKLSAPERKRPFNRLTDLSDKVVLLKNKGSIAQRGIAAGRVRQVHEDDDPESFPSGGIAVTKYTTPRLTTIIRRAAAIITDIGSPSGHMATVAREFGVPMIVNTGGATRALTDGMEVTVDAEENVVYGGIVKELLAYQAEAEDVYRDLKEFHILRRILSRVSPLYLIDPTGSKFTARNCRTYHDIVRFSHEKAIQILIKLNISSRRFRGIETRELELPIPLGLRMIDLGGGLAPEAGGRGTVSADRVLSLPMHAIITGLLAPGVWSTNPVNLDFGDLVSSLTRHSMADRGAVYRGGNLAVISDHYANISLRLGYHFNVIDTYVSKNVDDNYIYFRFLGGVTEEQRRRLRALLIKDILERLHFVVTLQGDLVVARLKKLAEGEMLEVLREIGRLIGFTRQLDTQMRSEQSVVDSLDRFFEERPS